ncbi:MAG: hypothetical protein IPL84_01675 [Chitinophagaceae bacterium]|nr:hypothetical protein [Chitinophagaceae bacterium]
MKWLHFILSHSVFIACCAVALAFQSAQLLGFNNSPYVYGFIFFATLCSYNFYWLLSKIAFADKKNILKIIQKDSSGIVLLILSATGLLICFYFSRLTIAYVSLAVLLTLAYAVPLLPIKFLLFTRKAGVLKTLLLAFTWAYVTVFIPLQKSFPALDHADYFILTRRFLFMLMLCIIFDNRDKAIDKIRGLHSLATDLKPVVLKVIIYLIFAVLFISNFLYRDYGLSLSQSVALQVSTLALLVVYFYAAKPRSYLFYYFIVDGLMLFSALATGIASI